MGTLPSRPNRPIRRLGFQTLGLILGATLTLHAVVDETEIGYTEAHLQRPSKPWIGGLTPAGGTPVPIPEPMVFDLIRPLGARQGELEINTLALIPLQRRLRRSPDAPDELGRVPLSKDRSGIEWAPEIEYALWDDFALEAEFPFEDHELEALKFAAQWTIGTALNNTFIHGIQGIWEKVLDSDTSILTGVYLSGYRFNEEWSVLSMTGLQHEFGKGAGNRGGERTSFVQNTTLFYELTEHWSFGLETNLLFPFNARSTFLVMPQVQYEPTPHWAIQFGVGFTHSSTDTVPQIGLRAIWTY